MISFNDWHPSNTEDSNDSKFLSIIRILFKDVQFWKDLLGIVFVSLFIINDSIPRKELLPTDVSDGKYTSFNAIHPSKTDDPNDDNLVEIKLILDKVEQPLNESFGIYDMSPFTSSFLTPKKAFSLIVLIIDGKVILDNEEHPSNVDSFIMRIDDGIAISVNNEQFLNAYFSNVLTVGGNSIFLNDEHPSKVDSSIDFKVDNIVICERDEQSLNTSFSIF